MPTRAFAITADDKPVALGSSLSAEISITVVNTAGKPLRGQARILAVGTTKADWLLLAGEPERHFADKEAHQFVLRCTVPAGTGPGKYSARLNVVSVQNPDDDFAEGPVVSFVVDTPSAPTPATRKSSWLFWLILALIVVSGGIGLYLALRPKPAPLHRVPQKPATTTVRENLHKPTCTVVLTQAGPNKIAVLKEVRAATNLGLRETKDLVESAPVTIKTEMPRAEAEALKMKLEAAGAKVELR